MRFITSLKKRIYEIIEVADPQDFFSKIFDIFILNLILVATSKNRILEAQILS